MRKISIACSVLAGFGALAATPSFAGPLYDATSTCTTDNCEAIIVRGTILSFGSARPGRWIEQVYAAANTCLRLDVTQATQDLETVVVDPAGEVFRDDDDGTGNNPLVKIDNTRVGYHTVSIGHWNGDAVNTDFIVRYGVYNAGNANCTTPDVALQPPTAAARAKEARKQQ